MPLCQKVTLRMYLGCLKNSGEQLRIGEEYSEDYCNRICTCTSKGLQCRTLCPDKTLDLLECKFPLTLQFWEVPADPPSVGCSCTRFDCLPPGTT